MLSLLMMLIKQCYFFSYVKSPTFLKRLSSEEEAYYLERLAHHDKKARSMLISHNLRLVAHVAKKYENHLDDMEDLISIGTIGLIKAVDSFKPDQKTRLATYAARCINNEILMHLRTNKKRSLDVSLSESIGKDKDGSDIELGEIIEARQTPIPEQIVHHDQLVALRQYLSCLNTREREIINLRYGLDGNEVLTQKQIASQYHISRSYVSRIEKRALTKLLREFVKAEQPDK